MPGTYYQYAQGKIVIWAPKDSKLDLSSELQSRMNPSINKIAVAPPQHAPYRQAAVAAMEQVRHLRQGEGQTATGREYFTNSIVVVSGSARLKKISLSKAPYTVVALPRYVGDRLKSLP